MNPEGVTQVGKIFAKEFESARFEVRWIPHSKSSRGHLFAERKGVKESDSADRTPPDTVFEKESAFSPFTKKGTRATGQGVTI